MKSNHRFPKLSNYFFFPVIFFALLGWFVLKPSWLSVGCNLYFLGRLYFSRQLAVWRWSLVSGLFAILFFGQVRSAENLRVHLPLGRGENIQVKVLADEIKVTGNWLQFEGMTLQSSRFFKKGDRAIFSMTLASEASQKFWQNNLKALTVQVTGDVVEPEAQRNLGGFDYRDYLKTQQVYRLVEVENLTVEGLYQAKGWAKIPLHLRNWRRLAQVRLTENLPEICNSLCQSLFLGVQDAFFKEQQNGLQELGILHLFSLTGLHLYFLVNGLRYLLLRLGWTQETVFWFILVFLLAFCIFSGMSISLCRVAGMLILKQSNQRYRWGLSALDIWSGVLFANLLWRPYLLFQMGGQISYGLTFGLLYWRSVGQHVYPAWRRQCFFSIGMLGLMLPFLWHYQYQWHILSFFLLGLFSLFLTQFLFPALFLPAFLAILGLNVKAQFLIAGLELFLRQTFRLLETLAQRTTFLQIVMGRSQNWQFILSLAWGLFLVHRFPRQSLKKSLGLLGLGLALLFFGKYLNPQQMLAMVDVGQGDSLFFQSPFHQGNYLIDTGGRLNFAAKADWQQHSNPRSNAENTLLPFLKSQGVKKLDIVFISHWDADHVGDLEVLAKAVTIEQVVYSAGCEKRPGFLAVRDRLTAKGVAFHSATAGERYGDRWHQFYLLAPFVFGDGGNDSSLVLLSQSANLRSLWMGDLEFSGEAKLLEKYQQQLIEPPIAVLKVGHHGSNGASSQAFLEVVNPTSAWLSCGQNNRYGHPHPEVLLRLESVKAQIYRTDLDGMVYWRHYFWQKGQSAFETVKKTENQSFLERLFSSW